MAQQHRSHDAVLTVCQNNDRQAIEISAASPSVTALLGYEAHELTGHDFRDFLPTHLVADIGDYVEFETGGNDIGTVLGRMKDFRILSKTGESLPVILKAVRSDSPDRNDWFKLILRAPTHGSEKEKLLALLQQNFKGHEVIDETLGLPDRSSVIRDVELADYHVRSGALQACFAIIELDHYVLLVERYSRAFCNKALKAIAELSRQNLRQHDVVGVLEGPDLGLVLLDITPESARVVLNRLRWLLSAKLSSLLGVPEGEISISVAFRPMQGQGEGKDAVLECEHLLTNRPHSSGSVMLEAMGAEADIHSRKA